MTAHSAPLSYNQLFRSFSRERIAAYSRDDDSDSTDAIARYLWNVALASAFQPVLHVVEVAFRNALYDVGKQTAAPRVTKTRQVDCWLTADPTLLQKKEAERVQEALKLLAQNPRRCTGGHLVSHLSFGFWVGLCNRPYEQGNLQGPGLWPMAGRRFPNCPRPKQNRADIGRAFSELRDFRNRIAHCNPIWDQDVRDWHNRIIERIRWMNGGLAAAVRQHSTVEAIFAAGHSAYRSHVEITMRL
ncbi:MAG TPA: hypothetical protein VH559_04190 [Gemmatimonadaceae bacterium]|jgi:hypothetical protein